VTDLQSIALDDPLLSIRGALHVERSAHAIRFHRLPKWTRAQSPDPAFDLMAAMTSGVRIELKTDAELIEIDALETGLQFLGEPRRAAILDLICEGITASAELTSGHTILVDGAKVSFVPGKPGTIRFALPTGPKHLALWLPQSAMTEVQGIRLNVGAQLDAPCPPKRMWAHYGSSISHGMEAAGPSRTWPALAANTLNLSLTNLGFAGQCHLDGFVARSLRDGQFDVISMEIGVNIVAADTMRRRTFAAAVEGFLDTIRDANPTTPLIVISPLYSALVETAPGPITRKAAMRYERQERPFALEDGALTLEIVRTMIETIIARRKSAGDNALHYINGLSLFCADDVALMPDKLHPDEAGHELMAKRFAALAISKSLHEA
jgi:lysophospholipase L1-like esterase